MRGVARAGHVSLLAFQRGERIRRCCKPMANQRSLFFVVYRCFLFVFSTGSCVRGDSKTFVTSGGNQIVCWGEGKNWGQQTRSAKDWKTITINRMSRLWLGVPATNGRTIFLSVRFSVHFLYRTAAGEKRAMSE